MGMSKEEFMARYFKDQREKNKKRESDINGYIVNNITKIRKRNNIPN